MTEAVFSVVHLWQCSVACDTCAVDVTLSS